MIRRLATLFVRSGKPARIVATRLAVGAALVAVVPPPAASAAAGSITVANQNDSGTGSLRQAIADASPGEMVIVPAGTYRLSSGELAVPNSLTIAGAGATTTIIDGQTISRVFHTTGSGSQITITGVTIRGGKAVPSLGNSFVTGGGVLNEQATLTLSDDLITGNVADADAALSGANGGDADGGGVYNAGTLNLIDTDVRGNVASADGSTGHAGGSAFGGGVFSTGATAVRGSTIEVNFANARGGMGPANANQVGGFTLGGGLLLAQNGPTSISATTLRDNIADGSAGPGASGGTATGGGGYMDNDNNNGGITETNVTYVGNIARATGGQSLGGGLALVGSGASQALTNVTISGNIATAGTANQGGNLLVGAGTSATIENTIVDAGEADPGSENCNVLGMLSSLGHNIDSRDQCNLRAVGDLTRSDALLAPLADNGGPVATTAFKAGSPAIDAGAPGVCPSTDARGALRPAGRGCDIGAFEVASPSATTAQASSLATSSAVLSGVVSNPDLTPGTAFFQYGTTTNYGSSTPSQPVSSTTARLQVSTRLSGLSPGTTYHFRIVAHNTTGTVTGADQSLTTTSPGTVPRVAVRSVSTAGATATISIRCDGTAGQRCSGSLLGKVREHLRGRSIVSISTNTRSMRRSAPMTKTVIVARGNYSVLAGRTATLRIAVNASGKRLLVRFYRLPTELVFAGAPQLSRTITFAYPRLKPRVTDFWTWTLPPCAPCVTMVQRLTLAGLPSGAHVKVSCSGPVCPFGQQVLKPRRRKLALTGLFAHSPLRSGTKLEILITAPNRVGEALFYTTQTGTFPQAATRCLPPGERVPVRCRAGS